MSDDKMFIVSIAHIPAEDLRNMNRGDILVADAIFRVNAFRRKLIKRYNCWVKPSQKYLANATGLHPTYISRCVCKLEKMGIIEVSRSKRRDGKWRLNYYQIGERVVNLCNRVVRGLKVHRFNRTHKPASQLNNKRILVNSNANKDECRRALRRFFGTTPKFALG